MILFESVKEEFKNQNISQRESWTAIFSTFLEMRHFILSTNKNVYDVSEIVNESILYLLQMDLLTCDLYRYERLSSNWLFYTISTDNFTKNTNIDIEN